MFRPTAAIFRLLQFGPLDFPLNKLILTRNDDEISAPPRNIGIYMILFEQNCNNLKMAAIGRNM